MLEWCSQTFVFKTLFYAFCVMFYFVNFLVWLQGLYVEYCMYVALSPRCCASIEIELWLAFARERVIIAPVVRGAHGLAYHNPINYALILLWPVTIMELELRFRLVLKE